jgi:DNA primase
MPKGYSDDGLKRVDLEKVDVETYLRSLNIQNISHEVNDFRFSCPYTENHAFGDNNPSAYMNKETTAFICFGCGAAGNAVTMLADVMNISRTQARYFIAEKWAPHFVEIQDLKGYLTKLMRQNELEAQSAPDFWIPEEHYEARAVDWQELADVAPSEIPGWAKYMLYEREFSPEILDEFEFVYDPVYGRPCVTVRDEHNRLVGFKGRAWREGQEPKYIVLGDNDRGIELYGARFGFPPYEASDYVFGINKVEKNIPLIVCEGEFNVASMHDKGYKNTIGPSGSTMTQKQVDQIVDYTDEVIIFFDYDLKNQGSALTAKMKIAAVVEMFEAKVSTKIVPEHWGDPAEMEQEEVDRLVHGARSSTVERLLRLIA